FFEPSADGGDPTYAFVGNRATLGVRVQSRRLEVQGAFQYAQLVGLPRGAVGPGPLGPGPVYFHAAQNSRAYQLYFKSMSIRMKEVVPGLSIEAGRMAYASNPESARLSGRLIGNADWTMSERAFDGVRVDYANPDWQARASYVMPTQGAYEESASPTMGKVRVSTLSFSSGGASLFGHHYRDTRPIRVRPDNGIAIPDAVKISIGTIGASHVREYRLGNGRAQTVVWAATQFGDWYGDLHHAFSAIADAGYRWPQTRWAPAIRGGIVYASGDGMPLDGTHRTFFPMLPTTRPDLLAGTYAQMNLRDLSAEVRVQPHARVGVSVELHRLSLVDANDHWYSGTGATAVRGNYFGYSSRLSGGETALGTFLQTSAEARLTKWWTMNASVGLVSGGAVVRRQFAGHRLTIVTLESRWAFE
nr:alginate export family protein [Acidobacteriota bacterium]